MKINCDDIYYLPSLQGESIRELNSIIYESIYALIINVVYYCCLLYTSPSPRDS